MKVQKVDKELMRRNNTKFIFSEIYKQGQISRSRIAELTKMSVMSAGRIADQLIEHGLVEELECNNDASPGRPPKLLQVASQNLHCMGVSLERGGIHMGVMDPYGKTICKEFVIMPLSERSPEDSLKQIGNRIKGFFSRNAHLNIFPAVGISIPGLVDVEQEQLIFSSQLQWTNVPVVTLLQKFIGLDSVLIENDIKSVALAENRFGSSVGYSNCVELNIGRGIGMAVILNGEIHRGKNNMAGEIGHIILSPDGKMCECGKRGCLQTKVAEWAILQEARAVHPDIELGEVFDAYEQGAPWAVTLMNHVGDYLSITINLLINTYSPDVVVLSGSLVENYPFFRTFVLEHYQKQLSQYMDQDFVLKFSKFGSHGSVVGAANLAFMHMLETLIKGA